jgi:hypothetical protein
MKQAKQWLKHDRRVINPLTTTSASWLDCLPDYPAPARLIEGFDSSRSYPTAERESSSNNDSHDHSHTSDIVSMLTTRRGGRSNLVSPQLFRVMKINELIASVSSALSTFTVFIGRGTT